jgi:hypothetical protein
MRRSRAVTATGEPAAAAQAPGGEGGKQSVPPLSQPGDFDGTFWLLHGGEAATQVAQDLAAEAQAQGFTAVHVAPMERFRDAKLDRCVVQRLPSCS